MPHEKVYNKFKELMPIYANRVTVWFPCGKNTIRIRLFDMSELIFSCEEHKKSWMLETCDKYMDRMKEKGKKR